MVLGWTHTHTNTHTHTHTHTHTNTHSNVCRQNDFKKQGVRGAATPGLKIWKIHKIPERVYKILDFNVFKISGSFTFLNAYT